MTLEECKIYLKTMRCYTPTRVDFTKTYHSPPKIHGVYGDSMETRGELSNAEFLCNPSPASLRKTTRFKTFIKCAKFRCWLRFGKCVVLWRNLTLTHCHG